MSGLEGVDAIDVPAGPYRRLVAHARRKLAGRHLPGEERAPKAYGLVGGRIQGPRIEVVGVFPLRNNLRYAPRYRAFFDRLMEEVAVPSDTPFERRGWLADPRETAAADEACSRQGAVIIGGYHMHRVPWAHDPVRDTCTELDRRLAEGSGSWMLILSMVDPARPRLRAFFEGRNDHAAVVRFPVAGPTRPRGAA